MSILHEITEALSGHGHDCTCDHCMEEHHDHEHARGFDRVMIGRLIAAGVLFAAGMILEKPFPDLAVFLNVLAILCAGYDVFLRAIANIIKKRLFDESLLMSIVAIASVIIGEASEGASVMLLYQLGELFQGYAVARVRKNIEGLMENRSPETGAVLADVRADRGGKGRTEEFITHFARFYTPVVLGIALVIAVISPLVLHTTVREGVYRALVLMVIACPCAIVISVPLGYFAGIGGATNRGILFKSTAAVVFDKAGALDGGSLRVVSVKAARSMEADVLLRIAAHAGAYSEGRHAEAIKSAYQGVIYIELIERFAEEPENGITVRVDGVDILLGTADYARAHDADPGSDLLEGEDCAYMFIDGTYAGRILFGSVAKPDVSGAVTVLSWERDRQIAMLTGDSAAAAEKFARSVGIGQYYAGCDDAGKVAVVRNIRSKQIKKGSLLFVGRAETDEECMKEADVGVSLYGASSDAAIRAADVVVMDASPSRVVTAIEAAKHTRSIVWQNIAFALVFKLVILALDMLGICPLWLAVFADVGVALLAVLNSLRAFMVKDADLPEGP